MSLTRNLHLESDTAHRAEQLNNAAGMDPALVPQNDEDMTRELTSTRADASGTDVPADYESAKAAADADTEGEMTDEIEEARRASWGMPTKDEEMTSDAANTSSTAEAAGLGHS